MCWKCKNKIDAEEKIFRNSTCNFCGSDLHCCRNCQFYDKGAHYDCRENISDLVTEKERANFCDFFSARSDFVSSKSHANKSKDALSALFGEQSENDCISAASAEDAFNALFGD